MAHENTEKSEVVGNPSAGAIAQPIPTPLPYEVERCVEVIQRLEACRKHPSYGAERQRAMQTLGVSERSLRRLQQQYRDRGIEGLKRQPRADEGYGNDPDEKVSLTPRSLSAKGLQGIPMASFSRN